VVQGQQRGHDIDRSVSKRQVKPVRVKGFDPRRLLAGGNSHHTGVMVNANDQARLGQPAAYRSGKTEVPRTYVEQRAPGDPAHFSGHTANAPKRAGKAAQSA